MSKRTKLDSSLEIRGTAISEWKRKMRVNPGHHQHHRDKAQNSGTVPPIPGRLATIGKVHFSAKDSFRGTHKISAYFQFDVGAKHFGADRNCLCNVS